MPDARTLVERVLRVPLLSKVAGANLLIVVSALIGVAVERRLSIPGSVVSILGIALGASLIVNLVLIYVALRPLSDLESTATRVIAGDMEARVPASVLADRDMARVGTTFNVLLDRLTEHARATARYAVYYGEGRDIYDVRGRVAHESIFNTNDGNYRCPNSQQGYSPFSTWTRGLAWAMCGFAEQLEFLDTLPGQRPVLEIFEKAARATCDFYIENTPPDGIPYWDTGAPGLAQLGDWRARAADPFNAYEPVDSSAAAIAAQGLLRLGHRLHDDRYWQAGLAVCNTLFDEPYLSTGDQHQGLILHSIYHRPNGWDAVPAGGRVPAAESSMWGDYHAREVGLYLLRLIENKPYLKFWV